MSCRRLVLALPAASKGALMLGVHSDECTSRARVVSGHRVGYVSIATAASRAAWAVAALVAFAVVSNACGLLLVVSRLTPSWQSKIWPSESRLPPSSTMSGFTGQDRRNSIDVRLNGDSSPAGATAFQPRKAGSDGSSAFSVYAPTERTFQACAGLCTLLASHSAR